MLDVANRDLERFREHVLQLFHRFSSAKAASKRPIVSVYESGADRNQSLPPVDSVGSSTERAHPGIRYLVPWDRRR